MVEKRKGKLTLLWERAGFEKPQNQGIEQDCHVAEDEREGRSKRMSTKISLDEAKSKSFLAAPSRRIEALVIPAIFSLHPEEILFSHVQVDRRAVYPRSTWPRLAYVILSFLHTSS